MMLIEEREKYQSLARQVFVALSDLDEVDKTVSRLRNELNELYIKVDEKLDES